MARFAELGYRARIQPFSFEALSGQSRSLSLSAAEIGEVVVAPMRLSGEGQVSGVLVAVGLATAGDVEEVDLDGKVALIQRGTISFQVKARRVAEAGAVAAVIYNNGPAMFGGNLREQASIPVVSISGTDGETIKKRMAEGEVRATVNVTTGVYQSRNVVAEKGPSTGSGRPAPGTESEQVVVLGGHFDTVADVLGAGDNGSGVATLLALARELSTRDYPFALRFVAFGSEEMGLHGSSHYVDTLPQAELERIVAMLNFDALGTGKTQVLGTPELRELAVDFADANGIDIAVLLSLDGFGSDHAPFAAADIPHLSFFSGDFSRIHTQQDTLEFVQPQLMGVAAFLGLAMLDLLAWS